MTSKETLRRIVAVCGKATATGVATADDMNMIAREGYPLWESLVGLLGNSTGEVQEAVSRGELDASVFIAAIHNAIEKETPPNDQLKVVRTGMNIYAGPDSWWVAAPTNPYAPQLITICGDSTATDSIRSGAGEDLLIGVPANQLDLLIEALNTVRKMATES